MHNALNMIVCKVSSYDFWDFTVKSSTRFHLGIHGMGGILDWEGERLAPNLIIQMITRYFLDFENYQPKQPPPSLTSGKLRGVRIHVQSWVLV